MIDDPGRPERTFTAMLVGAVVMTLVLAALAVADLRAARGGGTATSLVAAPGGGGAVGGGRAAATPGGQGTPADRVGGGGSGGSARGGGAGAGGGSGGQGGGGAGSAGGGGAGGGGGGSGGGGGGQGAVPSGPCSDCLPAGAPIPIGAIVTQTGPGRSVTLAHAIAAWARDVDRRGGINGHQIALDLRDDGGNPDTGAAQYRSIAQDEHALALVGECAPITDSQEVGYVNQQGLPDIGECQSSDAAYTSPYVYVAGPTPFQNGELGAKLMLTTQGWQRGTNSIALVCLDEQAVASTCRGVEQHYGDATLWSGHPQLEQIADNNYAQLIAQWRSDGVRYVHLVLDPGNTQRYIAAATDASWSVPTMENLAIDDGIASYPNANGMFIGSPWTALDQTGTPGMQRLITTLGAYYPDDRVDVYAQTGWIACLLFEHALQLMGPDGVSRSRLLQTLDALRGWDTGLGPVVSYSPQDHVGDVENGLMQLRGAGTPNYQLVGVHGPVRL